MRGLLGDVRTFVAYLILPREAREQAAEALAAHFGTGQR